MKPTGDVIEKRELGKTGVMVTSMAFGAWQIGGPPFWVDGKEQTAIDAIKTAHEFGINIFDTAPIYGCGRSERIVGKALKNIRDDVVIATKCGLRWKSEKLSSIYNDLSPASIRKEIDDSLARLDTDRIDLYQIHCPSPTEPAEPALEEMSKLREAGKIRAIGVSNFDLALLKRGLEVTRIDSIQPKYNLLEREIEADLLPFCRQNQISVLAYSPLASGLLTGKYKKGDSFGDWRDDGTLGLFRPQKLDDAFARLEKFKAIARRRSMEPGLLALAWALGRGGVTSALVGVKNSEQLKRNITAFDIEIDDELAREMEEI